MNVTGRAYFNPLFLTTILLWSALYAGLTTNAILMQMPHFQELLLLRLITCTVGALICGWMYLTLSPITTYPFVVQLALAFLISPMAAVGWGLANWNIIDLFGLSGPSKWPVMFSDIFPTVQLLTWVFLTWCGVYFSVQYRNRLVSGHYG